MIEFGKHALYLSAFHLIIIEIHVIQKFVAQFLGHISAIATRHNGNGGQPASGLVSRKIIPDRDDCGERVVNGVAIVEQLGKFIGFGQVCTQHLFLVFAEKLEILLFGYMSLDASGQHPEQGMGKDNPVLTRMMVEEAVLRLSACLQTRLSFFKHLPAYFS